MSSSEGSGAVRRWFSRTSVCGLSNARDADSAPEAAAWAAVTAFAAAFTAVQVAYVVKEYFMYEVDTNLAVLHMNSADFPAVSVCNWNRVHCGNLAVAIERRKEENGTYDDCESFKELQTLLFLREVACKEAFLTEEKTFRAANVSSCVESASVREWRELEETAEDEAKLQTFPDHFLAVYSSLYMGTRVEIGHQIVDLVESCVFKSFDCKARLTTAFSTWNLPLFGNCFTFNEYSNEADGRRGKRRVALTGSQYGLKMTLNLELGSYMRRGLTASEGARVAIFPKDINLMPGEYGVNLHPETKTEISLKSRSYSRLAAPFSSRCIRGWEDTEYSKVQLRNRGAYTIQKCRKICLVQNLQSHCRCMEANHVHDVEFFVGQNGDVSLGNGSSSDVRVCRTAPTSEDDEGFALYDCVKSVYQDFDKGILQCDSCRVPCEEKAFDTQMSIMRWPSQGYKEVLDRISPGNSSSLLQVDVFFKTLNTEAIIETEKISISTMISNLGGALSLMLGITVVQLLEFFGLGAKVSFAAFRFKR